MSLSKEDIYLVQCDLDKSILDTRKKLERVLEAKEVLERRLRVQKAQQEHLKELRKTKK